ncbi:RDD family protein [Hyunsoonleella pacifica]|uniref:RDD domain-containing protein n=1 Tax=Hyunsoonleella pacifica TaxID=1080224 RepID=A0A4Q9FNZ5_9FLAO|nr:RDD family protein [Hyunsoonleella pacifica]TBN16600.1 hypothetical protein EYD46_08170 [Hyunsoonleella pacifica]GGD18075.1 hypothetical protein GCM10011368_19980 [Hyunsoonleella pacifica]
MIQRINRLASMFLDHVTMSFVLVPLMIAFFVVMQLFAKESYPEFLFQSNRIGYSVAFLPFLVYFLKDSYRGKSVGKRTIGLQVVNYKTGEPANAFQCFVRNLFTPIWPLEVLVSIISPSRRLGDIFAYTKVIPSEKEKFKSLIDDVKKTRFSVYSILILVVGLIYCYGLSFIMIKLQT